MIDVEHLRTASAHLSDAIADPARWTDILEEIAKATGSMGAGLLPHSGSQGALASAGLKNCLDAYIREGWSEVDRPTRKRAMELLPRSKVALDRDLVASDEQRAPFFDDFLPRFGGKWWAGIGFQSGPELWSLTLHRSPCQGPFRDTERAILREFSLRLDEIGGLAHVAGRITLSALVSSFDHKKTALVAIGGSGKVIHANATAEHMFSASVWIAGGRLMLSDRSAAAEYNSLVEKLGGTPEGKSLRAARIVVRRKNAPALLIEALPVDGAAKSPFLHARALLLINEIAQPAKPDWEIFSRAFGLTPAEARLAARLATGESLQSAAEALRITKETSRSRVKSIFRKTDTHRQADLVALSSSLPHSV